MLRRFLVLVLVLLSACTPDRKTFTTALESAVRTNDAKAVWALLDRATKDKILAGLRKSREKAAKDEEFRHLREEVAFPAKVDQEDEEAAISLIHEQFYSLDKGLSDDGKNPRVHLEDGVWKVAADPVGFVDPDGAALSLRIVLSPPPEKPHDVAITSLSIDMVELGKEGKTDAQISEEYKKSVVRVVQLAGLPDFYAWPAIQLLCAYQLRMTRVPRYNHVRFTIGKTGALTATYAIAMQGFGGDVLTEPKAEPTLEFRVYP